MDVSGVSERIFAAQQRTDFGGLVLSPDVLRHVTTRRDNLSAVPALVGEEEAAVVESSSFLPTTPFLRQEPWTVPLLAASCVNAAAIVAFEVYVLVRAAHGTPSRRHLFLGQCLLLGLLLCALCGLPLALQPSAVACAALRLSVSIAPSLVFGTLLVKCVFLISLNSGVYLPAHYQALLLFFVVLVQVSISVQWLAVVPATVLTLGKKAAEGGGSADSAATSAVCSHSYEHTLLSLVYVMLLMLAVAVLAIKCRGYRENYRESSYIGASVGVVIPLWLGWIICGLVLPVQLQSACIGGGMLATSTVVFVIMFIPKGRQMAAVGRDGLYRDDREDRLSTVSDARYSPSFFLFKPVKSAKETPRQHFDSFYKSPPSACSSSSSGPSSDCAEEGQSDEGLYSTIGRPLPNLPKLIPSSNPNFYLFRSHSHTGMFY